ncbi:FapA family protein [Clostridium sp.]|uniref:FapA family protein n=2 Tax=Clostridium sp. TaxID=1506 RepID=UPI002FCBCE79
MIFTGKSLDEAKKKAEEHLGKSIDELEYKVNEKKVGFFKKEYEVEVFILKRSAKGEIRNKQFIFHEGDGEVLIKSSSKVQIKVNGTPVNNDIYVKGEDTVEVEGKTKAKVKKLDISISEDKMQVKVDILSSPTISYEILDSEPGEVIEIKTAERKLNDEESYTVQEIKVELVKRRVIFGIDDALIEEAIKNRSGIVAKGIESIKSVNDKIVYFFNVQDKRKHVEVNGKVDYYSIEEIESVDKDVIIAKLEVGKNGVDGMDVLGGKTTIKPKKDISLKTGVGARLNDDATEVFADTSGRPCVIGGKISVLPIFQVQGDADLKIGNIEFDGDIVVNGDVKEGMKLSAGGSIIIGGSVLEASLHSKGDLKIRGNLIASSVKVGNVQLNELKYIEILSDINIFLDNFIELTEKLQNIMGQKARNIPKSIIAKKVIDSKFIEQKLKFKEIRKEYIQLKMSIEIKELIGKFFKVYMDIIDENQVEFDLFNDIQRDIGRFLESYNITETSADVYMSYSQNSKVYSSRSVYINGKGCYCTEIEAEGEIIIEGMPGTFRSGTVYGKKGVKIREIGSVAGVKSIIKTDLDGVIEAETVYHNTLFMVGGFNYYVDEGLKKVKVFVKDGDLVVEKFKL